MTIAATMNDFGMLVSKATTDQSREEFDALLERARVASDMLKAMSHETRLLILGLLTRGEQSVSALENLVKLPQAAVSQQLARLRYDGLVQTRREGRQIYYSLANAEVTSVVSSLYELFCSSADEASRV